MRARIVRLFAASLIALMPIRATADRWPTVPFMDDMRVTVVGENMKYNGTWMNAYEITSSRSVDEIVTFYEREWAGKIATTSLAGPVIITSQQGPASNTHRDGWKLLTHREADFLITIQVGANPESGSLGYVGVTQAFDGPKGPYKSNFPMPRDSDLISDIVADDLGKRSRTVMFLNRVSVEHNLQFYRNYYGQRGWDELGTSVNDKPVSSNRGALLMSKGSSEVNLAVARNGIKSLVTAVIVEK